jgi:uroporphyrinogen-III synthase
MQKLILNIRPAIDSAHDMASLRRRGVAGVAMPVFEIKPMQVQIPDASNICALIFTSRHAITAFSHQTDMQVWSTKPVFVVGHATAAAARGAGFLDVVTGTGGGAGLVPEIHRHLPRLGAADNCFLWPAGVDKSFDMAAALTADSMSVETLDIYRAEAVPPAPEQIAMIDKAMIASIIVMSARSARLLCDIFDAHELNGQRAGITLIVGSQSIADAAGSGWRQIYVAAKPRRSRLLAIATLLYHHQNDA